MPETGRGPTVFASLVEDLLRRATADAMLEYGQRNVDKGTEYYENRYRQQQIHLLQKKDA